MNLFEAGLSGTTLTIGSQTLRSLGSELVVHFAIDANRIDPGDPDAVDKIGDEANTVGRFDPRSRVRLGNTADVAVNTAQIHFFDPATA